MCDSKICFKCDTRKPLTDFYKHKGMADGYLNKCKECNKKDTKENTEKNKDYYVEMKKKYSQTESGKESCRKSKQKWMDDNLIKRSANIIIGNAVRDGKIIKPLSCSQCNVTGVRIHGHHDDYAYPMAVRWLCSKCHTAWHKENGSAING